MKAIQIIKIKRMSYYRNRLMDRIYKIADERKELKVYNIFIFGRHDKRSFKVS